MDIIILTQYYPPETGAPQNRLHSLAKYIASRGDHVRVFTAFPNYPVNRIAEPYQKKLFFTETIEDIQVFRSWIYVTMSRTVRSRLLNYFSFVISSFLNLLFHKRSEVLLCESPPLFLGISAVLVSWLKRSQLIFNVSDLWPESAEKLGIVRNRRAISFSYRLESWIYKNASLISGQTQGIVKNIQQRFPQSKVVWVPNGIDMDVVKNIPGDCDWRTVWGIPDNHFVVLYAGIIGHAQGLDVILQASERLKGYPIHFVLVGDGPEKKRLVEGARVRGLEGVRFHEHVDRAKVLSMIKASDAYVVPLKKLELFKGAIPSKLFEPLALGKPLLLGIEGEAKALFVDQAKAGLYFQPENSEDLSREVVTLFQNDEYRDKLGKQGRKFAEEHFNRNMIHEMFLGQIEQLMNHAGAASKSK